MLEIITVKKILESCLDYIQQDFASYPVKEETFLYQVLGNTRDGNFDFYEQGKNLFTRTSENTNKIGVILEYPKDKTSLPVYVLREPGKMPGIANSIGKIESFMGDIPMYRDTRQYEMEVMCFSANVYESILMSEVMYALLLGSYDILASQFLKIDFTMKELMAQSDLIPTPIFIRTIGIELSSTQMAPGRVNADLLGKIIFGKVNQEDSFVYGENPFQSGLPGVKARIGDKEWYPPLLSNSPYLNVSEKYFWLYNGEEKILNVESNTNWIIE